MDSRLARTLLKNRRLSPEEFVVYREQRLAFQRKFGREMAPDDPFFFDPDSDVPQFRSPRDSDYALAVIARLMGEAGIDPAHIYAFRKTRGLFPTNAMQLSPEQQQEWSAAVREYGSRLARSVTQ
jgi:hypothetical protein